MYDFNKEPIYFIKRDGTLENPYSDIRENVFVQYQMVFLKEIPLKSYKVSVLENTTILSEVGRREDIDDVNDYYVDYKQGIVYLSEYYNGKQLSFEYKGTGVLLYPSSRIYIDDSDTDNNVVKSLRDLVYDGKEAMKSISTLEELVHRAETEVENAIIVTAEANEAITTANQRIIEIDDRIVTVDTMVDNITIAEEDRSNSELIRKVNEDTRISNEDARKSAESTRKTAESARIAIENNRAISESTRVSQESARVTAENTRKTQETSRANAESTRVTNESTRKSNEDIRKANEIARQTSEDARESSEEVRQTQESTRQDNEDVRNTNETARQDSESIRVSDENIRKSNEEIRKSNEDLRILAEDIRELSETERVENEDNRKLSETNRNDSEIVRGENENIRQSNENTRNTNETARNTSESERVTNENTRKSNENTRISNEDTRKINEDSRKSEEVLRDSAENTRNIAETERISAEDIRKSNEDKRIASENIRTSSEEDRIDSESARNIAEDTRQSNESIRQTQESARKLSEDSRVLAETSRVTAENTRDDNEDARKLEESKRVTAESTRTTNENTRKSNETARATAESTRVTNENARKSQETTRQTNETARTNAENERISNEDTRELNESTRKQAELTRQSQESQRQTNTQTAIENAETATLNANTATANANTATSQANAVKTEMETLIDRTISVGEYSSTKTYYPNNFVLYNESTYICIQTSTGNNPTNTTYFSLVAKRGNDGIGSVSTINNIRPDDSGNLILNATNVGAISSTEKGVPNGIAKLNADGMVLDGNGNIVEGKVTSVNGKVGDIALVANDVGAYTKLETQTIADTAESNAKNYTDSKVAELVDSSPETLNTLNELASALGDDPNFATTMTTQLGNKVDKVTGKQLSTEDFTTAEKTKLNGIATGANNYVHPSSHPATIITQDSTHRFVTDTEKSSWNAKASTSVATTTSNGLMSSTDKVKLDSVETGANNYTHPSSHPATMITEDASHRFVTDSEKSTWNAKATTSVATTSSNGLMLSADKAKLDGIEDGANNYIHPSSHPATMITEDSTHRFVTDTEKSTWNAKASTSVATTSSNGLLSSTDKAKLDGISASADVNQNAFSNVKVGTTTITADTVTDTLEIVAGSNVSITADATNDKITISSTNTTYGVSTTTSNGLMSSTDKSKLDGVESNANNYVHPSTHPASIIVEDATHRFATDSEKSTWNGKLDATANAVSSSKWVTARTITLGGDLSGSVIIDGSANATLTATIVDDSHNHIISNVDGLQTALDGKLGTSANAVSASKLATPRTIALTGDASGSVSFDGSSNVSITVTVNDDSHTHSVANITGLQTVLDSKLNLSGGTLTGALTAPKYTTGSYSIEYNSTENSLDFILN